MMRVILARIIAASWQSEEVVCLFLIWLCFGTYVCEGPLRENDGSDVGNSRTDSSQAASASTEIREAELPSRRSQAELGNEKEHQTPNPKPRRVNFCRVTPHDRARECEESDRPCRLVRGNAGAHFFDGGENVVYIFNMVVGMMPELATFAAQAGMPPGAGSSSRACGVRDGAPVNLSGRISGNFDQQPDATLASVWK